MKPKVRILRGASLNNWEMQNYAPLLTDFDVEAVGSLGSDANESVCGVPIVKSPMLIDYRAKLGLLANISFMNRLGERYINFDSIVVNSSIVHTADLHNVFSDQTVQYKNKHGYKVVATIWENIPFLYNGIGGDSPRIRARKKRVIQGIDHFIAITERAKNMLLLEGALESNISVVPVGINTEVFKPREKDEALLKELQISKDTFTIVSIGRAIWHKGQQDLLFAMALLQKQNRNIPDFRIVFVAKGETESMLRSLTEKLDLKERVRFIQDVKYEDIPKFHSIADVFYLDSWPSMLWQEQFGMVFAEAMASGTVVLAGHSGSIPEVIGDAGILLTPGDYTEHADVIADLMNDEQKRLDIEERARTRAVNMFDSQTFSNAVKEIYQSLL